MSFEDEAGATFRQEAGELVAAIERGLLDLEGAPQNIDQINAVFRDLHTVKGSGAMFGHTELAQFVHNFETAFDQLREGKVKVSSAVIAVSLRACDHMLGLLADPVAAAPAGAPILEDLARAMSQGETGTAPVSAAQPEGWRISFRLPVDALRLGHNPQLLIDELLALGEGTATALTDSIPSLDNLEPTDCVTGWVVELKGAVSKDEVESVFMFQSGDTHIDIVPLGEPAAASPGPTNNTEPAPAPSGAAAAPAETGASAAASGGDSMRVATERLDELMDRVGELVIAEARLQSLAQTSRDPALLAVAEDIQRLAAGLRDSTMSMRMMPIGSILGRFRRLVRDLSGAVGKKINFEVHGEETELDKTVIELLADPLVHMIRNAADHGLEGPDERLAAGKSAVGTISFSASYSGAEVLIEIRDDGRGLNSAAIRERAISRGLISADTQLGESELLKLIFEPGFSTAAAVTELSGRGVGMDVVRRTIEQLRGQIELESEPGHGTTVTLRLPLTLAIIDGLLIEVGDEHYTIPLAAVEECVELPTSLAKETAGSAFLNIRGALVPFLRLRGMFRADGEPSPFQKVVVVAASGQRVGLVVDRIVANNQTVIKQLSRLHSGIRGFSGATILGDGRVALILDVPQLVAAGRQIEDRMRKEVAA